MAAMPFKAKAIYAYNSEHDEDLNFPEGQILTVTEEEDADWYIGEYLDSAGTKQSGLFPKNFVERFEPAPPPRPVRASRPKPVENPVVDTPQEASAQQDVAITKSQLDESSSSKSTSKPANYAASDVPMSPPILSREILNSTTEVSSDPKPVQALPAKKGPPPVAEKGNSLKDRLAMFNQAGAKPVVPFKPGGAGSSNFIKKPFIAPPPSRSAYVPQTREVPPPQTIYIRDEDPEIAQRRAEDEEAAKNVGLAPSAETEGEEHDAPKLTLKERIAALQKEQQNQAARRADTSQKEKPKRPAKKRVESYDTADVPVRDSIDDESERPVRGFSDVPRESVRRSSKGPKSPDSALPEGTFSEANDADQSAAGETTEDADRDSAFDEEAPAQGVEKAPIAEAEAGDEEVETEEEDEMDEDTRHQQALRERMAKLSGGMGMTGMFGPSGGMPMPMAGVGGAMKKKKPAPERRIVEDEEPSIAPQPLQRIPGIAMPGLSRTMSNESGLTVGKEDEDHSVSELSGQRGQKEVSPTEDEVYTSPPRDTGRAIPTRPQERAAPSSPLITNRGVPPPVPSGGPSADARVAPVEALHAESDSDDDLPQSSELPVRSAPPPIPNRDGSIGIEPRSPPPRSSMDRESTSQSSPRARQRLAPQVPISSPTVVPSSQARPPPPTPQAGGLPTRQPASNNRQSRILADESEYEGDYDTDIASNTKHKDALSAHARESSLDDSTTAGDTPVRSPAMISGFPSPPSASAPRSLPPPLPPTQAPPAMARKSGETPRAAPPRIPTRVGDEEDEYDPYSYVGSPPSSTPRAPALTPKSNTQGPRQPPALPTMPPPPPVPVSQRPEADESDEDDLYSPPIARRSIDQHARRSTDRAPPPLPPQAAPAGQYDAPAPAPPANRAPTRPSGEFDRSYVSPPRVSTDPQLGRPSISGHRPDIGRDFIADDVDLAHSSRWWTRANAPPPELQGRPDILYEVEESSSGSLTSKTVYVVYQDYSQTVITAQFDARNGDEAALEQHHEPPPSKLRQDQLEAFWTRFGSTVAKNVQSATGSGALGDGSAHSFVLELLRPLKGALSPVGSRAYGALVYANLGNATVQQFDEIRPGDVATFRNTKFSGKHGGLHTKYSLDLATHVGVVTEWDGTKKKVRIAEQGKDTDGGAGEGGKPSKDKSSKKKGKVELESYRLGDLRSGEVRVWRIVSRGYVGWNDVK